MQYVREHMVRYSLAWLLMALIWAGGLNSGYAQSHVKKPDVVLWVKGLSCPFCAYGLEKKLKKLSVVKDVEVQMDEGKVLIVLDPGQPVTQEDFEPLVARVVKEAGFTLERVEYTSGHVLDASGHPNKTGS